MKAAHRGWHSRGYLPHFDDAHEVQSITFRLHDSLPVEVVRQWKDELRWHRGLRPDHPTAVKLRVRTDQYEDRGLGCCWLRRPPIARLVQGALLHFDQERYRLLAWCVMPNHVHVLIQTRIGHPLTAVVASWKSYTAKAANRLLCRTGTFWMADYHDRYIRDERHYCNAVAYIEMNPVRAGLVERPEQWPYSSAHLRSEAPPFS